MLFSAQFLFGFFSGIQTGYTKKSDNCFVSVRVQGDLSYFHNHEVIAKNQVTQEILGSCITDYHGECDIYGLPYDVLMKVGPNIGFASCNSITNVYCPNEGWLVFVCEEWDDDAINKEGIPVKFKLRQNFPNPFNPETKISFDLPVESNVKITIYDVNGKIVDVILNKLNSAGYHSVVWNTSNLNLSSGVYFYKIEAGNFTDEKKMALIK